MNGLQHGIQQLRGALNSAATPCYCGSCKKSLSASRVLDSRHAWCPRCQVFVHMASFQLPSWTIGVVVLLFAMTLP